MAARGRHGAARPPTVRSPRTRRVNRTALGSLGLAMLLGGGAGLAAGLGAFGDDVQHGSVLAGASRFVADHRWLWAVIAATALVTVALAVLWLVSQVTTNRLGDLDLTDEPARGRTRMPTAAVSDAVRAEIERYPGVRRARARLVSEHGRTVLLLFAALDGRTNPGEVRGRIQDEAIGHARQALDNPGLPARIELQLPGRSGPGH